MSEATLDQEAFAIRLRRDLAESEKLMAEREKLYAEALKLSRERMLAPVIAIGGILVGGLGLVVAVVGLMIHVR